MNCLGDFLRKLFIRGVECYVNQVRVLDGFYIEVIQKLLRVFLSGNFRRIIRIFLYQLLIGRMLLEIEPIDEGVCEGRRFQDSVWV